MTYANRRLLLCLFYATLAALILAFVLERMLP